MAENRDSELDVVAVQALAERVFEDRQAALDWMARPNQALAGATPMSCCVTEVGAQQVRRILLALEYGGVA